MAASFARPSRRHYGSLWDVAGAQSTIAIPSTGEKRQRIGGVADEPQRASRETVHAVYESDDEPQ